MKDICAFNKKHQPHGYWEIYWWPKNNLNYKGNFVNGKKVGYWEKWFFTGGLWCKVYYI